LAEFSSVLKTSDVAPGEMKLVTLGDVEIVVANVAGSYCAFGNTCPHEGGPLAEGELDGDIVTCPWHFTEFNIRTGEVVEGVTDEPIPVYEVRVEDGEVQVAGPGG
jgi:nitrite reductase (NADH) small subunit/3-phenylpropionate/trans-cinnamate dioxygenase ferredoxin subunit